MCWEPDPSRWKAKHTGQEKKEENRAIALALCYCNIGKATLGVKGKSRSRDADEMSIAASFNDMYSCTGLNCLSNISGEASEVWKGMAILLHKEPTMFFHMVHGL